MLNTNIKREYEWSVWLHSTCNSRQKAVIVWIRNHQRFCLSLVCLETQEHSDHICMFNELRWILWSQTLFNSHQQGTKCAKMFLSHSEQYKRERKRCKTWRNDMLLLALSCFLSSSQCLSAHICRLWSLLVLHDVYTENKPFKQPPKSRSNSKISQNLFKFLCCLWRKSNQNLVDLTAGLLLGKLERILALLIKKHTCSVLLKQWHTETASHSITQSWNPLMQFSHLTSTTSACKHPEGVNCS